MNALRVFVVGCLVACASAHSSAAVLSVFDLSDRSPPSISFSGFAFDPLCVVTTERIDCSRDAGYADTSLLLALGVGGASAHQWWIYLLEPDGRQSDLLILNLHRITARTVTLTHVGFRSDPEGGTLPLISTPWQIPGACNAEQTADITIICVQEGIKPTVGHLGNLSYVVASDLERTIPEPGTLLLFASALLAAGALRRRAGGPARSPHTQ